MQSNQMDGDTGMTVKNSSSYEFTKFMATCFHCGKFTVCDDDCKEGLCDDNYDLMIMSREALKEDKGSTI